MVTSVGIPVFWGDELLWQPRNFPTDLMVGSMYMAMGIIMVLIAKQPKEHKSFIDFIVIANILHALVMIFYAQKPSHIYLDSTFMFAMGMIPLFIYPWPIRKFLRYKNENYS